MTWEARTSSPPDTATLRIALHSDVSGRALAEVVNHRGAGRNVAYVNEDPRAFFLLIESKNVDWSVDVAEGIPAVRQNRQ